MSCSVFVLRISEKYQQEHFSWAEQLMRSPAEQKCWSSQESWLNGGHQSLSEIESTWYTAGPNVVEHCCLFPAAGFFLRSLNSSCSKNTRQLMVGSTGLGDLVINLCWLNRGLVICDGQADHLVGSHLQSTLVRQCWAFLWRMGCCSKLNSCALSLDGCYLGKGWDSSCQCMHSLPLCCHITSEPHCSPYSVFIFISLEVTFFWNQERKHW